MVTNSLNAISSNDRLEFYLKQLKHTLDTVQFCKENAEQVNDSSEVYYFKNNHSLLETLSRYLNLNKSELWPAITDKLTEYDEMTLKNQQTSYELQTDIFKSFTIQHNVIHCLKLCKNSQEIQKSQGKDEISNVIEETLKELVNLTNLDLQIQILENIFALLFLQNRHLIFSDSTNDESDLFCTEKELRLILSFLKTCCETIKSKKLDNIKSEEFRRFTNLNKNVTDGMWRLELIKSNLNPDEKTTNILPYMLASRESLINLCLKQNDFEKAYQVIQIFNLESSHLASSIIYTEKLLNLKQALKTTFKIKNSNKDPKAQGQQLENTAAKAIEEFFKSNPPIVNEEYDQIIAENLECNKFLSHYKSENDVFMNIFDLAVVQPNNFEDCEEILQTALEYNSLSTDVSSPFLKFCKNLVDVFNTVNCKYTVPINELLCNPYYNFNVEKYNKNEEFHKNLCMVYDSFLGNLDKENLGNLNTNHVAQKTFLKLQDIINPENEKENVKLMNRLLNYLKAFVKVLYIENNNSDIVSCGKECSVFEILEYNRSEIMERLLFERKLDPSDFEQLFYKLKLDLLYHIAANCFPKVNINSAPSSGTTGKTLRTPTKDIIAYIQKRNWLLAFIISQIHKDEKTNIDLNEIRVKHFLNFLKLPAVQNLAVLFDNSPVTAALQSNISVQKIQQYFDKNVVKLDNETSLNSQVSVESLETGEEIFEGHLKITNWKHLYDIIDSVPQNQLNQNQKLMDLRDMVLNNLVNDCFEPDYYMYVTFIQNDKLRQDCILNNFKTWPGTFCIEIMKSEISRIDHVDDQFKKKLNHWWQKIELYENIKNILKQQSWYDIFTLSKDFPQEILQNLVNTVEIDLLLKFIESHNLDKQLLKNIDTNYFVALFDSNVDLNKIRDLLDKLPTDLAIDICFGLFKALKKLEYLECIATYLSSETVEDTNTLKNIQISLKILSCFTNVEQEQTWCLISEPLSILEVLVMNTKLEKLGQVVEKIKSSIENSEYDENKLSVEKIDEMLRNYAEKSLEFRVIVQPEPRLIRTPENKLMESFDSLNMMPGQKTFVIPEKVPDKNEWIQNHEVVECMCCQQTAFSMFNRRHHCRRCGRVICGNCSLKRMQVATYGNILVRVCLDCYDQSHQDGGTSSSKSEMSSKSMMCDYWLLSDDPYHNAIVREEFSYEHAPSVSLCLAILKHHSRCEEYPRFLLDQCDNMLELLQPVNMGSLQEIDYLLVIRMLKSLAVAAKMLSTQCVLQVGTSLADRILSQADLLELLAERGCLHIIPTATHTHARFIDAMTLRRLRDKLLEREQWHLALEVSTKAGLDNTGVFAAWGKSCLKAGSLQLAREKFQRCFDKMTHYDTNSEFSDSFSSLQRSYYHSKAPSVIVDNRPVKNPPLLNEIIQILECNTKVLDQKILKDLKNIKPLSTSTWSLNSSVSMPPTNDTALCILNKLKNLNSIVAGNYSFVQDSSISSKSASDTRISKPYMEPIFYEECVYYLTRYGSHLSLLQFYIKVGEVEDALKYVIENRLNCDIFIEIYTSCLKDGIIDIFQEYMSKIDSTLDIWKEYLKNLCRHLEKHSLLHSLYQLQQFMGDYIRAAMTCIKFYQEDSTTFSELATKIPFLHKAQEHLKQELEQEQWVEVATGITNPSLVMRMDSRNIDKHINTIWRQIEIAKFLAECEAGGTAVIKILPDVLPFANEDPASDKEIKVTIPTLFGSYYEKVQLAVLAIICGNNVEDGFGIAFRIIQDYKLSALKVYCQAGKQLAKIEKYTGIAQLVSCIRSSGVSDSAVTDMCDEMLTLAVQTLTKANISGPQLDGLIKLITDRAAKISAYIESKQLKSAYLLAVKHKRMGDVRRILREAEFLNQPNIKILCQKILQAHSHSKD